MFPELLGFLGSHINELLPTFGNLIKDPEIEVKDAAIEGIAKVMQKALPEKVIACIIPAVLTLQDEGNIQVKAHTGKALGSIASNVGFSVFQSKLTTLMDALIKDDNNEVKMGCFCYSVLAKACMRFTLQVKGFCLTALIAILEHSLKPVIGASGSVC